MKIRDSVREVAAVLALSAAAIAVNGYHFGVEDAANYVPALKHALNPGLYPFDAVYFPALTRYSLFVPLVTGTVRATGMSLEWASLAWHLLSIFVLLMACRKLARVCFGETAGQWGAVVAVWGAMLLPVAGTGIATTERYLHPRNLAIGAVIFGIAAAVEHRPAAFAWIVAAVAIHPTIGVLGAYHAAVQWWKPPRRAGAINPVVVAAAGMPLLFATIVPAANPAWRAVLESRRYLFLQRWHWYEWLGVIAPLLLLEVFASVARHDRDEIAAHVARRAAIAGILGTAGSLAIGTIPAFISLVPMEPMRVLQVVYLLFVLIGGGLIGRHVLVRHRVRWVLFALFFAAALYAADKFEYPSSEHIEWPGAVSRNPWIESFVWVRDNTPKNAFFALDPLYTQRPGEDVHGFRAFAERSMTADAVKDQAIAQVDANVAFAWTLETRATCGWKDFRDQDFVRLGKLFQVDWVLLARSSPAAAQMNCPHVNASIAVCSVR